MLKKWKKMNTEDKIIDFIVYFFCTVVLFISIYPFYYIFIVSFNEGIDASLGGIYWFPRKFTLDNYRDFFSDLTWINGLVVSVMRTVAGTSLSVLVTTLVAYGLSFRELKGRKIYMLIIIVSTYFGGGVIPYYAVLKTLGLINTFAVYVIPGALSTFYVLIGISFFEDIPRSLRESAKLDGATEFSVFRKIILPLSKPFLATLILFIGVGQWNNWYDNAIFVVDKKLSTIAFLMMKVINASQVPSSAVQQGISIATTTTTLSIQAAAMMVATLPIICIYPFLQKYFVSGIMIGAVKE